MEHSQLHKALTEIEGQIGKSYLPRGMKIATCPIHGNYLAHYSQANASCPQCATVLASSAANGDDASSMYHEIDMRQDAMQAQKMATAVENALGIMERSMPTPSIHKSKMVDSDHMPKKKKNPNDMPKEQHETVDDDGAKDRDLTDHHGLKRGKKKPKDMPKDKDGSLKSLAPDIAKARDKKEWAEVKKDKKAKYGKEIYADKEHDSYPLTKDGKPSEERTMAAWRYINETKDAKEYSASKVSSMKAKIRRFAKEHFGKELK